jgi:signal transduction histidine kinase
MGYHGVMDAIHRIGAVIFGRHRRREESENVRSLQGGPGGRSFNLLSSFALLSLLSIMLIGVASGIVVLRFLTHSLLQEDALVTMEFLQSVMEVERLEHPSDASKIAADGAMARNIFLHIANMPDVVRANVYGPDHVLVWSTEGRLVGNRFESNEHLRRALSGELVYELVNRRDSEKAEHAFFPHEVTRFVETYVPIWTTDRGRVVAVAELYKVPQSLFKAITSGKRIIIVGGISGGSFLYLMLFWIVRRASNLIDVQREQLEDEIEERKRAEASLRRSEHKLGVLSSKLLGAQEIERQRVASELHDGLGQSLSAIKFSLERGLRRLDPGASEESIEVVQGAVDKIHDAVEEVRNIAMDLRPTMLDDLGILATLKWFCREFQQVYPHIKIEKRTAIEESDVPKTLKVVIYRIVQEALNNIAKHAEASEASIELAMAGEQVRLSISDNGRGFNLQEYANLSGEYRGVGLQSMSERAEFSGGEFSIRSRPGDGTTIEIVWLAKK